MSLKSCSCCTLEVCEKFDKNGASGFVRGQMERVRGEEGMYGVCTGEDLRCCVHKIEEEPFNDVRGCAVGRLVDLLR